MRINVRQRILAYVSGHPGTTAYGIARALDMSPAAVRHHLAIVSSDGRIVSTRAEHQRGRRGRPMKTYRMSDQLLGDNLAMVASELLDEGKRRRLGGVRNQPIDRLVGALLERLGAPEARAPMMRDVDAMIQKLNALHYWARWEAGAAGPRILFGHCPYAAIIEAHPELCEMDRRALAERMQSTARQGAKIDTRTLQPPCCVFTLAR
jgi:predicted ArsR family transcriptional regulator